MRSFVLTTIVLLTGTSMGFGQQAGDRIIVTGEAAQLRSQTATTGSVPKGALLTVREVNGEWLWVNYQNGTTLLKGWLSRRDTLPLEQALDFVQAELQRQPQAEMYNIRGTIYFERGAYDQSLADCNEAIRLDPNRPHFWNNRGNIWRAKGDQVKAINDFNQAVRIDPDYQVAYKNRGNVWSDRGAFDKAIADYDAAIQLLPTDADAFNNRGSMRMQRGEFEKAIEDWKQSIKHDPGAAQAYNNLAWLLATCKEEAFRDPKLALELATRACELGKWKNAGSIDTLASVYAALGDQENAVKWQTKAVELAPETKKASYRKTLEQYRSARSEGTGDAELK
jgi:tetratricopeptide (TPR) repeat protein